MVLMILLENQSSQILGRRMGEVARERCGRHGYGEVVVEVVIHLLCNMVVEVVVVVDHRNQA